MSEVKRIDIAEFRKLGFLQEANRLFFHPHGLALESTTVGEEGWAADSTHPYMRRLLEGLNSEQLALAVNTYSAPEVAALILDALFPPGSQHLSGVWDYRDDPEGVVFGDGDEGKRENFERVREQRRYHFDHRCALFAVPEHLRIAGPPGDDVEPIGWTVSDEQLEEWRKATEAAAYAEVDPQREGATGGA